jgi:hypothetical protein
MLKKKSAQPQREGVSIIESSKRETWSSLKVSKSQTKRKENISSKKHGSRTPNLMGRCGIKWEWQKIRKL